MQIKRKLHKPNGQAQAKRAWRWEGLRRDAGEKAAQKIRLSARGKL